MFIIDSSLYFYIFLSKTNFFFRVVKLIDGKGGGKKGQFQGKASSFKNVDKVEDILKAVLTES